MQFFRKVPATVKWIVSVLLFFLMIMTAFRLIFFFAFNPSGKSFSGSPMLLGLRFDLKFICMLCISMLVLCSVPFFNPVKNHRAGRFWNILLTIVFAFTLFFYAVDYYHYDYLQQRLNASVLAVAVDTKISANMAWETYPVIRVVAALVLLTAGGAVVFKKLLTHFQRQQQSMKKTAWYYVLFFLLFALAIFGKLGQFNLRWSDAFLLQDSFKANMSLNPFQSFFSTLRFRDTRPDVNRARACYPEMAALLGVQHPDSITMNYDRVYHYDDSSANKPNVVLVICESFSMYKSSMSGNPLNTTPFFDSLSKKAVFFDRCYTPSYPTARGVWATVTGIPDVLGDNNRSASRNPEVVSQNLILNDISGYEKFYFLGGDPTWANIKGMLLNNIDSLHLFSQENFAAKKVDVWGIDDKNLFLEANKELAKQQKPFFAIIQTADNHRPYTIPEADLKLFKKLSVPEDTLAKYGFETNEEFNAFRYTDFCFSQFFKAAQKEKYFDNTIFVFVGDHGIPGNSDAFYPKSFQEQRLTSSHVPLMFYSPKLLQPKTVHLACSQIDIMPSIAHIIKANHTNSVMGKNLFDSVFLAKDYAFIINHDLKTAGIVNSRYYFIDHFQAGKKEFVSVTDNLPVPHTPETDSIKAAMQKLTDDYLHTSKYILFNNKKRK